MSNCNNTACNVDLVIGKNQTYTLEDDLRKGIVHMTCSVTCMVIAIMNSGRIEEL